MNAHHDGITTDKGTTLEVLTSPFGCLAILGTAKNVGKTTTLNHLIAQHTGGTLGLTSIGRDGEARDVVTDRPKPRIRPGVGTLVATARACAVRSTAGLSPVQETPFQTALGPIRIYRVESPGQVEVSGPVTAQDTQAIVQQLQALGASQVLVDGAIDRRAAAAMPAIEGLILATGMALASDPDEVLARTACLLQQLGIAQVNALPAVQARLGAFIDDTFLPYPGQTTLDEADRFVAWIPPGSEGLLIDGAVTEALGRSLCQKLKGPINLVVGDPTQLMLEMSTWEEMRARGITCTAKRSLKIVAVTLNPTSPWESQTPDPMQFLQQARTQLAPTPVFDLGAEG